MKRNGFFEVFSFFSLFSRFCILAMGFIGCQNLSIQAWPLVHTHEDPVAESSSLEVLSPFFYSFAEKNEKGEVESGHSLRPIYDYRSTEKESELVFLWPIGRVHQSEERRRIQILPLYSYNKKVAEDGTQDTDWFVALILWGGSDKNPKKPEEDDSYFAVFPLYGTIQGILGKDELFFAFFPLYYSSKDGDYETRNYLWPLFSFGSGGGKSAASYLPFYGYSEKKNSEGQWKYHRQFYLWPFVQYQENDLDEKYPSKAIQVFPFYGESVSEVSQAYHVLWPFFTVSFDQTKDYHEYNLPWPFFKRATGKNLDELRIWPLYGYKDRPQNKDAWYLWPLGWWNEQDNETFTKSAYSFLPLYWSTHKTLKEDKRHEDFYKVWPLFHYATDHQKHKDLQILSPLWFQDYRPEGFEKLYSPLWSLFSWKVHPQHGESFRLFGPLYSSEETPSSYEQKTLLYTYSKRTDSEKKPLESSFSLLYGLLGWRSDAQRTHLKLFYLPEFISWLR